MRSLTFLFLVVGSMDDSTPTISEPDERQVNKAIEVAKGEFGSIDAIQRNTGHARTIFTQQLIHDIQRHTIAVRELETTMSNYSRWSKRLSLVLIIFTAVLTVLTVVIVLQNQGLL